MKKKLVILLIILFLSTLLVVYILFNRIDRQQNYTMYIQTDSLIKIVLDEQCIKDKCDLESKKIIDYEIIFDDALEYDDVNFKNKDLKEVLALILDNIESDEVIILTDYEIDKEIENNFEDYNFSIKYDSNLNEENIIADFENDMKYYTVTFDTRGGSSVDSVVIRAGEKIEVPKEPTREGYKFIEWILGDEGYDFDLAVNENITLVATWEKEKVKITKSSNEKTTKTNNNSKTTNKPTTMIFNGFNLNDDIKVIIKTKTVLCGFAMFATNLETVFPDAYISSGKYVDYFPTDGASGEITEDDFSKNGNKLVYDTKKENTAINLLKKYKNSKTEGLADVEYSIKNHRITYSYTYLTFSNISYKTDAISVNTKIDNAFKSAYKFIGPCGGGLDIAEPLTEELCEKYHLSCTRK